MLSLSKKIVELSFSFSSQTCVITKSFWVKSLAAFCLLSSCLLALLLFSHRYCFWEASLLFKLVKLSLFLPQLPWYLEQSVGWLPFGARKLFKRLLLLPLSSSFILALFVQLLSSRVSVRSNLSSSKND